MCPKCREPLARRRDIAKHLRRNTDRCNEVAARLEAQAVELKQQAAAELEARINIMQENNKKVIDNLVNTQPGPKERRRVIENFEAQGKILNFENVVRKTKIPEDVLRVTVELMAEGDIILFRRIFIDHVDPQFRCIRVKDFAREKYEFFDGETWVTTTLTNIVDQFAKALHSKYKFLIMEKAKKVSKIDNKYHPYNDSEKIAKEIDDICIEYANITEHVTKLGIQDQDFMNEIKRGISGYLANSGGDKKPKKTVESAFEYNSESEEIESISLEDEEINEVFLEDHTIIPILRMMGIRINL
jgi:hypothetical protein